MLITKHFVFLHMPKTGGSFVRQVCRRELPSDWLLHNPESGFHVGHDAIPEEHRRLPVLCFVRNPWDWYVSWYHDRVQREVERHEQARAAWWTYLFDSGRADFREMVVNACTGRPFDRLPEGGAAQQEVALPRWVEVMRERGVDHYTARFLLLSGTEDRREPPVEVGRFENLRADLLSFLERHDIPVPDGFRAALLRESPVRSSDRGPYGDYYDDELRDLVAAKAKPIIDRYGYRF